MARSRSRSHSVVPTFGPGPWDTSYSNLLTVTRRHIGGGHRTDSTSLRPPSATASRTQSQTSWVRLHFKPRSLYRLRELKARARSSRDRYLTDPETGVASGETEAAICVQNVDVQCVLQFTLIHAAGCVLHRHTSRVIHRLEFSFRSHSLLSREQALTDESHQATETYCGKKR